ncbi:uncharacterized protein [Panulirus ornatus]|uniref:uncharacterized protein n=1 Tax=Panulirus ornatus TaxID=150431 RepID=UPI003A8AAC8A
MNALVVFSAVAVAVCSGAQMPWYPGLYGAYPGMPLMKALAEEPIELKPMAPLPLTYNMAPLASMAPIHSQYNSRDEFGQYAFGYNGGFNNRAEIRDAFGNVRGSYNYLDADGKVQTQHYVADALGYRVQGTNLPEAIAAEYLEYAEDVAAARADHMAAHEAPLEAKFIDYAEDVAAARADHMAAHEAAAAPAALPEPKYIDYAEDVAAARAEHLAAHEALPEPKYIDYTEDVAAARAEHLAAHDVAAAPAPVEAEAEAEVAAPAEAEAEAAE